MRSSATVDRVAGRLLALTLLALAGGFLWFAATPPAPAPAATRTDGIVVLTGDSGRLARGLGLMRAGAAKRMLVSGVDPVVRRAELAAQARAPTRLFACCVDLGRAAVDTRSNAEEAAVWARARGFRSIRLVTSSYHMRRAMVEFEAELPPGVTLLPDAVAGERDPGQLAAEYLKWLWRSAARAVERA